MKNNITTLGLLIALMFFSNSIGAQEHDKNWLLGYEWNNSYTTQLRFDSVLVLDSIHRNLRIRQSNISMSDSLGNLLFYSNGIKIYNAQYQLMQNGDSLNPGPTANQNYTAGYPYYETMIAIPHPSQPNKYYIFHQSFSYASIIAGAGERLYYSLVDMNANGGLGRVEKKNQRLLSLLEGDSICGGQLEVVKHGNGRDWWLVQPLAHSNGYRVFLIADSTVRFHHSQHIGNVHLYPDEVGGQATFSPNGTQYFRYDYRADLDIYDFNRCTGYLSNYLHIPIIDTTDLYYSPPNGGGGYTGLAVAPNSRFLYLTSYIYLYQFDLQANDIAASIDTVAIYDNFQQQMVSTIFQQMQNGPNGKIYFRASGSTYLHVVDSPNVRGIGCHVIQRGVDIYYGNTHFPSFPHYRMPPLGGSGCDTLTAIKNLESSQQREEDRDKIKLYPNPATGILYVESDLLLESSSTIAIYNSLGKLIKTVIFKDKNTRISIDVSTLIEGVYLLQLTTKAASITQIFIVNN